MKHKRVAFTRPSRSAYRRLPSNARLRQTMGYGDGIVCDLAACGQDIDSTARTFGSARAASGVPAEHSSHSQQCKTTYVDVLRNSKTGTGRSRRPGIMQGRCCAALSQFPRGRARIVRCLNREDNTRRVTNK